MDYLTDKKTIGERLQKLRKTKYKTQDSFAEALYVSDRKTISKWETGETEIPISRLPDICNKLDCDLDYLFGRIDVPKNITSDIMQDTGLSETAVNTILTPEYTTILNVILSDENFKSLLDILLEWSAADCDNTHGNIIRDNIRNKLSSKSNISDTTIKILSILSKEGHSAIYRPLATEKANKMFDTVTKKMFNKKGW